MAGFDSFLAGAANAGSQDIQKRRDSALEIKMRSTMLEQQANYEKEKFQREQLLSPQASQSLGALGGYATQPGEQFTAPQASLFQGVGRAELQASSRRGMGTDRGISDAAAKILSKKYGMSVDTIKGMKSSEINSVFKSGSDTAIKDVEAAVQSLSSVPEFYGGLKQLAGNRTAMFVAQTKGKAGLLAYPDVQNARNHMITLMAFSNGGKNLTKIEKDAVDDLATSWAYGPKESDNAERRFRTMLVNNINPRLKSGALGMAREELVGQFNEALVKNGLEPIPLNEDEKKQPKSEDKTTNDFSGMTTDEKFNLLLQRRAAKQKGRK